MQLNTRLFGEIEIEEEKIIFFENGIIGFQINWDEECRIVMCISSDVLLMEQYVK